jgi:hypothetical protein
MEPAEVLTAGGEKADDFHRRFPRNVVKVSAVAVAVDSRSS